MLSSIFAKNNVNLSKFIRQLNERVSKKYQGNGLYFVSDDSILRKNGIYLSDEGTNIFTGNIVNFISHYILKELCKKVACNDYHFEDQNRYP